MLARCRAAVLVAGAVLLAAPSLHAVETTWRLHAGLPAQWEPTFGIAFVMRVPIGAPPEPTPSASGPQTLRVRNWFVHTMAAASLNSGDLDTPTAFGEVGIVHRATLGPFDRAGLMMVGKLKEKGIGPALRLEALNGLVAVQPGWMWLEGHRNGPSLTIDISLSLPIDIFRR
jgi:hypothetical protein